MENNGTPDRTNALVALLNSHDEERIEWLGVSLRGLAAAYGEDEVEYPLSSIREL